MVQIFAYFVRTLSSHTKKKLQKFIVQVTFDLHGMTDALTTDTRQVKALQYIQLLHRGFRMERPAWSKWTATVSIISAMHDRPRFEKSAACMRRGVGVANNALRI